MFLLTKDLNVKVIPDKSVICNRCGKPLDVWDVQEDFTIQKHPLGYGTIFDGETLNLRLCCECMEELINDCVVSPIIDNT